MSNSIKIKFRQSMEADREGSVYFQIIHNRVVHQLATDYKIFPSEWDNNRSTIVIASDCKRLETDGVVFTADGIINDNNRYADKYYSILWRV